ncbi:MAG: hypothetical protein OEQ39_08230, partial [Gammaproteobacteria bacterium]|nr:hypothetical protein [Gammaproteobacteria bacterium]
MTKKRKAEVEARKVNADEDIFELPPDNPDIIEGMPDPNLVLDYDPRFSSILGTGISRRTLLK